MPQQTHNLSRARRRKSLVLAEHYINEFESDIDAAVPETPVELDESTILLRISPMRDFSAHTDSECSIVDSQPDIFEEEECIEYAPEDVSYTTEYLETDYYESKKPTVIEYDNKIELEFKYVENANGTQLVSFEIKPTNGKHLKSRKIYECPCGKVYHVWRNCADHKAVCPKSGKNSTKKHACPVCAKSFLRYTSYYRHWKACLQKNEFNQTAAASAARCAQNKLLEHSTNPITVSKNMQSLKKLAK